MNDGDELLQWLMTMVMGQKIDDEGNDDDDDGSNYCCPGH